VALHTAGVTAQSRGEVHGGSERVALAGLAVTGATTIAAVGGGAHGASAVAGAVLGGAAYAGAVLPSQLTALEDPSAANVRTATRAGIGGMIPLQATLVARTGALLPALALGAVDLLRRRLAARRRAGDVT
jgi:4-hydroxybenzoate polyprenyltransferase